MTEALIVMIKNDLSVSNGSACTSSSYEPSHVLKAMDLMIILLNQQYDFHGA